MKDQDQNQEKNYIDQSDSTKIKVEFIDIDEGDDSVELKLAANCSNG